jgi:hypothetical protein
MSAQQILLQKYGEPDADYQAKFCTIWNIKADFEWFPASRFLVNKDFMAMLVLAFQNITNANLQGEIKTFDGCYNNRMVRGAQTTSLHAWAAAIDLNASIEARGQTTTHWTPDFLQIMKDAGIFWGGDFHTIVDNMHFAMLDG